MFRQTVVHADGTSEGDINENQAVHLLRRAARRRYRIEATTNGGAVITWTARFFDGRTEPRSITFIPQLPVGGALTDTTVRDLALIDDSTQAHYKLEDERLIISCGLWRIPPAATARLRARGLVTEEGRRVRLTLAARLALLACDHRTRTTEPAGCSRPSVLGLVSAGLNKPGRRAGLLHSSASTALCGCGYTAHCGDRTEARRKAADHRAAMAAEFVVTLP